MRSGRWMAVVLIGGLVAAAAGYQPIEREGPPGRRGGPPREHGGPDHLPIQRLFPPLPTDHAPLDDAEREQLLEFVEENMPRLRRALHFLERRNPERFEARMAEAAPRLRHLRRIYESDPDLGRAVGAHALSVREIKRLAREAHRPDVSERGRQQIEEELRVQVTQNVRIEANVLRILLETYAENRAERVAVVADALLQPDVDTAPHPPPIRRLIEDHRAAADDATRAKLREALGEVVGERLDQDAESLQQRLEHLRRDSDVVVDQRVGWLMLLGDGGPGWRHGDHDGGRRGDGSRRGLRGRDRADRAERRDGE